MIQASNKCSKRSQWFALALMVAIFLLDMSIRMGIAVGVLYLSCLPLLISKRRSIIIAFTSFATLLILSKIVLFYDPEIWFGVYVNRFISVAALWATCISILWNKKLTESLETQREHHLIELQRRNEELQQFAYVASHDLQEPLRTMSSFVELFNVEYNGRLDENARSYLKYITRASDRMRELVRGLLDYSLIGKNSQRVRTDCYTIVSEVVEDLQKLIIDTHSTILIDKLPVADVYPLELMSLFRNLISNGIKFRQRNRPPVIRISSAENQDEWEVIVSDNGIGIEEKYYERIFLIFQRLHTREDFDGSGIGLAHCKKIVRLHEGRIWVTSKLTQGSQFHFTIKKNSKTI